MVRESPLGGSSVASGARRANVAKLRAVGPPQLAHQAVAADREAPHALRHFAGHAPSPRIESAGEDAHLHFLSVRDSAPVERQAVGVFHASYAIDDALVVAGRWLHQADRRAAPDADRTRRRRWPLRRR